MQHNTYVIQNHFEKRHLLVTLKQNHGVFSQPPPIELAWEGYRCGFAGGTPLRLYLLMTALGSLREASLHSAPDIENRENKTWGIRNKWIDRFNCILKIYARDVHLAYLLAYHEVAQEYIGLLL